ncbi:amino acid adenylation domain-containing protein [Streptomyces hirsutus]|uniref:non-ribosomal peptide synthetase n=1 Tax=Streptomyces hirsutus TaxID=35620 RepID=UPI0036B42EBF
MKQHQPEYLTVPELIQQVAARTPEAVALEVAGESLTYGDLWCQAGSVAIALRELPGFRPGEVIGTLFSRSARNVVAQLGVWRAGGAYLPIDPALPDSRIRTILDNARPTAVIAEDDLRRRLPATTKAVHLDTSHQLPTPPQVRSELAYVIYTSGSTGTPKGVEVGHASLANLVDWHLRTYGTAPGVRVAALAGLGFDASVWEVWTALACGATLVLPSELLSADSDAVCEFLDSQHIEQCFLSTPLAERLFAVARPPRALRVLTTGGDQLRVYPPADFPAAVFNHYGPTEATVVTTATEDLRGGGTELPWIGRPITKAEARLVSDGQIVTEPDAEGELFIGGQILAHGYRHDKDLTNEKFLYDADGARWYASGDVCRWDLDGQLRFVGRQDGQVSVRGHRIELAEIEHAMLACRGVDQAKATVRPDEDGGTLAAFYCGTDDEGSIRTSLAQTLPRQMLPTLLLRLDTLPLNSSGKIDVRSLEVLGTDSLSAAQPADSANDTPADPVADEVMQIWTDMLGHPPQPGDHFFEVGGHSLMAARVTGRVGRRFDVQIGLKALFDAPVFADYVQLVAAAVQGRQE